MASDKHSINMFTDNQLEGLENCDNSLLLLQRLSLFFTWSNHSILSVLAMQCDKAAKILYTFNCKLNSFEVITSYPIPCFSSNMIPLDMSTHTILAIRYDQELYESTLQDVYDFQSMIIERCHITQHCLQLLAVRNNPTIFYWNLCKCVAHLISTYVPLQSSYLHSRGIVEVLIYPDLSFTLSDRVISIGTLAFCDDSKLVGKKVQLLFA